MHRLVNGTQGYDWGSTDLIPRFLGAEPDGSPVAEIWVGTHPLLPSSLADDDERPLQDVAGRLPFLLKVLAAGKPLSLQVHPDKGQAETGFAAENEAGIPLDAPHRVFRDDNHKPEMAYALTQFETLVGFRPTAEILRVLDHLRTPLAARLSRELHEDPGFPGIVRLVERLLRDVPPADEIEGVVAEARRHLAEGTDVKRAFATVVELAEHYPGDVGVVVGLLLNRLTLQPGEAAFLDSGIIHAHLSGMCLEIMAESDNVLRAGLTSKHIDPAGLVSTLTTRFSRLARVTPEPVDHATVLLSPGSDEFALAVTQCSGADGDGVEVPGAGERLLICTGGEVALRNEHGQELTLRRGDTVHAGADDGELHVRGLGEVAQAFQPASLPATSRLVDLV
ncbi:mannose-6-phosphate isomerase, class I [Aeromicrobium sp. IC_218]|uniref:mannose-6-phosphate isomerase, class I n=1 Tax=Aeromicrobium sp. IC_218 TaxID=2545468 RepID=UPI0013F49467|nr:mannose-6-phosphate isomerase, class I [Aeromicrobium sp. IC_218]